MSIASIRWASFTIPFVEDFETSAAGTVRTREGVIIEIGNEHGEIGLGEASPLPERGDGNATDVAAWLAANVDSLVGQDEAANVSPFNAIDVGAALRCGLETALLDLRGKTQGERVADLLASGEPAPRVPVNATIGARRTEAAAKAASVAVAKGFSAVKLKVGVAGSVGAEEERVAVVRAAIGPGVRLRLDANGAWDSATAIEMVAALRPHEIEWIEQPVPAADINGLAAVRRRSRIRVAADESLRSPADAQAILDATAADVLVLKPMQLGGPTACLAVARLAREAGAEVVVTTTIDSGVAAAAALHTAAALGPDLPACGLATLDLLERDLLLAPLRIERGEMSLPATPGLGIAVETNLAWSATD